MFIVGNAIVNTEVWMEISISIEPYLGDDISLLPQYLEKIVEIKQSIPGLSVHFDYFKANQAAVDLVKKYAKKIDVYVHLMHQELTGDEFKAISRDVSEFVNAGPQQGLVFDLGCELTGYEELVKKCRYITVMSVKCGKSGQTFNSTALALVKQIRALNPQAVITIDGGINNTNIKMVKNAGVDIAVVGNYAKKCYENGELLAGINRLLHD